MKLYNGWLRPKSCESGACIEVIKGEDGMIKLRSSLSPYGVATMTEAEFKDFVEAAKAGEYDRFYDDEEPKLQLVTLSKEDIESAAYVTGGGFKSKNLNLELDDGGVFTWEEQRILKEGYTCDL